MATQSSSALSVEYTYAANTAAYTGSHTRRRVKTCVNCPASSCTLCIHDVPSAWRRPR